MKALLVIIGWIVTAVAACLFGIILEHTERHHSEGTRMGIEDRP